MSILHGKSHVAAMSPITQRLDALLRAEGFYALEIGCTENLDSIKVNRLEYMRADGENVFIFVHEPKEA